MNEKMRNLEEIEEEKSYCWRLLKTIRDGIIMEANDYNETNSESEIEEALENLKIIHMGLLETLDVVIEIRDGLLDTLDRVIKIAERNQ